MNIEGTARDVLERVGLSDAQSPSPLAIAQGLLGHDAVRMIHCAGLPGDAALVKTRRSWCIYLRTGVPVERRRFAILHEVGHYVLGPLALEEECDALAAALLVPRAALRSSIRRLGLDYKGIAAEFGTTPSCVALRRGEAFGVPVALVTPQRVRARGEDWAWPPERELRRCLGGPIPGVSKTILEAPGRVLLAAENEAAA